MILSAVAACASLFSFTSCSRTTATPAAAEAIAPAHVEASPKTASFKFPTQTLTVPDGFTVELVAGPPMVNRPISAAFDEQGRLYATDSSGLSDKADKQFELKPHRIVRLEDADGDGRFDRSTLFADKMMFPQGALFYEGSLYVAAPPHIWKLTDTDGDGTADKREAWFDGKTLTGCANDVHGPYLGPDGWIYWTKGAFAEQHHTLGNGKEFTTRAAHIFRARPDYTGFEPVLTGGMDNPVGVTFSPTGDRFLSGTFFQIGSPGKRDGLIHSIYGGVYGKENAAVTGHPRTGDLMPIMTHMGAAAPCGSTTYRSRIFGADYTDNLFVCYFNLRKIVRHELVADGATFMTKDTDFITSDSLDFHPTDVLEDADGSLLVVDTGGWYKVCCPTSQIVKPDVLGGIYRIRKNGAPKVDDPRGQKLPWSTMQPPALAKLLGDERPQVRLRATQQLGKVGATAVPAIAEVAKNAPAAATRRNAVWTLARIEIPAARTAVAAALADRDSSVAYTALQVASLSRDAMFVDAAIKFLSSDRPTLVRVAAETLGRIGDPRAIAPLLHAVAKLPETKITAMGAPENPAAHILEHSLIFALLEIGHQDELAATLKSNASPHAKRAALVALDQMENSRLKPEDVIPSLDSPVPMLKQTAGWIVSHHTEWGDALAAYFSRRLGSPVSTDADLENQLALLAKSPAIQELLAATITNTAISANARLLALRAMAEAGLKDAPESWLSALATALTTSDPALARQAVTTARHIPLPKAGHAGFSAALVKVGRDARVPDDVRVDALAVAAPPALAPVDTELFSFLCAHLDAKQPMLVRSAAATVLSHAPLSPEQQLALTDTFKTTGPLEAPKLLPAFEKKPNEQLGLKLIAALKQSPGLAGVRPYQLKPLFAKYPKSMQPAADAFLAQLNAEAGGQFAHVEELLPRLKGGDVRRGELVFNSNKTACTMCHMIGYRGGRLGPDLTNIGRIRTERDLLESIVYPSASFVRGFEPFVVTTKSGEAQSGILKKDAPDEVVLATGPESELHIARSDVVQIQPGTVSPMPPGLEAVLSAQELADLVAFLKSRS